MSTLPTFFVIGAPKCGTTSLHHYLDQHPAIEMSRVKEPQVFAEPDCEARLGAYDELFAGAAPVRGESSAVYSQFPRWPDVPRRIREHVPAARFLYLVRDPVERAVAHYAQHVADGKERRSLDEALADWPAPDSLYLCPSRYATQVRRYLEHFDAARLLVVDQADLLRSRGETLRRVFAFLEVDPAFESERFERRLNTRDARRAATALGERIGDSPVFERARRMPLPGPLRRGLRRLVSRRVGRDELDPPLAARISESLRPEVEWLREFSGLGFADWSL